jgi:hypothetical protein
MDSRSTKATVSLAPLDDPWGYNPIRTREQECRGGVSELIAALRGPCRT